MNPNTTYQIVLFRSAAIFNWLACLIFMPATGLSAAAGFEPLMTNGPFEQIALLAIALFGLGYWMAGNDFAAYRSVILLGLIGKIAVVAIMFGHYFLVGDVNLSQAALTLGDVLYSVLFIQALRSTPAVASAIR